MKIKKIAAILLAAAMTVVSLAGCSTETPANAATYNGGEVAAGVYIFNQISALNAAYAQITNPYMTGTNVLDQKIDGVTVEQWVIDGAAEATKMHAAMKSEADRLGVTLDEETVNQINSEVELAWTTAGSYYDALGISKEAAAEVTVINLLADKVFEAYYGEGGEHAVPADELKSYFDYNFRRCMMIVVSLLDPATGVPLSEEQQAAAREAYAAYKDHIANGTELLDITYLELQRMNEMMGITDPIPVLTEQQAEMLFLRDGSGYPQGLSDMIFADGVEMNTPLFYEDDQYLVIFDVRELDRDGTTFESYKPTLLSILRSDDFIEKIEAVAETINFAPVADFKKAFPVRAILMAQAKANAQ